MVLYRVELGAGEHGKAAGSPASMSSPDWQQARHQWSGTRVAAPGPQLALLQPLPQASALKPKTCSGGMDGKTPKSHPPILDLCPAYGELRPRWW